MFTRDGFCEFLLGSFSGRNVPNSKKSPQFLDLTGAGPTREVHFLDLGSGVGKKLGKALRYGEERKKMGPWLLVRLDSSRM